jgi:hypothetical protein
MSAMLDGNWSNLKVQRGALIEWAEVDTPLVLFFEFNPTSITRTRTATVKTGGAPGTRGGYDFSSKSEVPRASQGVTVNAESFSVSILLDATDRMNAGDTIATEYGIQPELDTLRSMVEPKSFGAGGARTLAALGEGGERACTSAEYASVLLFIWGIHVLPVFLTQAQATLKEFLPNLVPYRAEVSLQMQVIESNNDFYIDELKRQFSYAGQTVGFGQGYSGEVKY